MNDQAFVLTPATLARILRAVTEIENIRGPGVTRVPGVGISIATPAAPATRIPPPAPNKFLPVRLTQTGGSAGSSSAYCTYTYTVKDITNTNTLGTAVAVLFARPFKAQCITAATYGVAYYDSTGAIKILSCDEVFKTTNC